MPLPNISPPDTRAWIEDGSLYSRYQLVGSCWYEFRCFYNPNPKVHFEGAVIVSFSAGIGEVIFDWSVKLDKDDQCSFYFLKLGEDLWVRGKMNAVPIWKLGWEENKILKIVISLETDNGWRTRTLRMRL